MRQRLDLRPYVLVAILATLATLLCVGCRDATAPEAGTEGVFALTLVAGQPVPTASVFSGSITLRRNQTFTDVLEFLYMGARYTDSLTGDYVVRGDSITFHPRYGMSATVGYQPNRITFGVGDGRWEYDRQ